MLVIDVKVLVDDFVRTYRERVEPILATPSGSLSRASMQKRLDNIRSVGHRKTPRLQEVFTALPHSLASDGLSGPA